jgi:hypothetical protein
MRHVRPAPDARPSADKVGRQIGHACALMVTRILWDDPTPLARCGDRSRRGVTKSVSKLVPTLQPSASSLALWMPARLAAMQRGSEHRCDGARQRR